MKAAIIGASREALHTIEAAKELGVSIIALDGNAKAEGLAVADESIVVNISNEVATIEALRDRDVDFTLTVPIGRYLTTIGAVNDEFDLDGISKEAAVNCTDKYLFHEKLNEKGLRDCECKLVKSGDGDVKMSFPAILKPRYGSGSRAIYFINNSEELDAALEDIEDSNEDFVLEEAVDGVEYGLDAAVIEGKLDLILLRKKINTPPPARQAVGYYAIAKEEAIELYEQVQGFMEKVVEALAMDNCLMHADIMISEVVQPFLIEVSARPSGHYLHNIFTPFATGVDVAKEMIKRGIGEEFSFAPRYYKKSLIRFWDMEDCEAEVVAKREDVVIADNVKLVDYVCNLKKGDRLGKISGGHSIIDRGYFILEGNDESELEIAAKAIIRRVINNVK